MQPRFSVITPVRNGLRDVHRYVECLQSQTYRHWEAIVVDDGSCDGGMELLQQLTAADPRFRLNHNSLPKQIPGPYQARNLDPTLQLIYAAYLRGRRDAIAGVRFESQHHEDYLFWQCCRQLGYSRILAALALLGRGLLQAWLIWSETTRPPIQLNAAER